MKKSEPQDYEMSAQERKECKRVNRLFDAAHTKAKHRERVRREIEALKAGGVDRMVEAFEKADEKAIQLHELLVRLMKMTNEPSKRHLQAKIISFDRRMREGKFENLDFIQEAFLMGVEIGADDDVKVIRKNTSPEAQQENAEKGNDRAIRKRQKQKADRRKADAGADRKENAIEMMFQVVDEAEPSERMMQVPASEYVWKKLFSHLKDLSVKPPTIRRWYCDAKRKRYDETPKRKMT